MLACAQNAGLGFSLRRRALIESPYPLPKQESPLKGDNFATGGEVGIHFARFANSLPTCRCAPALVEQGGTAPLAPRARRVCRATASRSVLILDPLLEIKNGAARAPFSISGGGASPLRRLLCPPQGQLLLSDPARILQLWLSSSHQASRRPFKFTVLTRSAPLPRLSRRYSWADARHPE